VIHLTLNQISAYIDAELPEASIELVRLHLSSCLECTERFGHIEEQEGALARLLVNEPGDPFFEHFTERVLGPVPVKVEPVAVKAEPVAVKKLEEAPASKRPETPPVSKRPEAPSVSTRPERSETPLEVAPRAPKRKGGAARFLLPAAALLLVASAVAVLVTRPRLMGFSGSTPRAEPENAVSGAGAADSGTEAPRPPSTPQSAAGAAPGDGADLLEAAATRSADADRAGTAEAHDAAAAAWEAAIPELQDNSDELAAGRREIAAARYRAWTEGATPDRREAAMRAVRAYILCAPSGPDRDRAWTWLAKLKR
jgi:hypothetical protein